jgi:hypothetical protein
VKPEPDPIRRQLAALAASSRTRILGFPRDWRPGQVVNPEDGQVFTPAGAWSFIAQRLEQWEPYEEIELDNPKGKKAYVMLIDMGRDKPKLYVKVQLGSGKIIGRSFHYSEY